MTEDEQARQDELVKMIRALRYERACGHPLDERWVRMCQARGPLLIWDSTCGLNLLHAS